MNIYIYGNQSFKKEIHETLEHANIKFKLGGDSLVKEINSLEELKDTIKNNPKEIYLIDDEKIIKKNSLNQKLKFLTPKDGIDEEFLLDSGIADLSIDSLKEIPKYILKKYEEEKKVEPNIQESIIDIVDEAYEKDDKNHIELDDELALLLSKEDDSKSKSNNNLLEENKDFDDSSLDDLFNMDQNVNLNELEDLIGNIDEKKSDNNTDFNDDFGLNNISFDYDDKDIVTNQEFGEIDFPEFVDDEPEGIEEVFDDVDFLDEIFSKKEEKTEKIEPIKEEYLQGEKMLDDEFSELDSLNEKDLLEALSGVNSVKYDNNMIDIKKEVVKTDNSVNIVSSTNVNDLAQLISKLLTNKTLEITIKIKD